MIDDSPLGLTSERGQTAFSVVSRPSPAWRVILHGRTPGVLVDSHLLELLNPPPPDGMNFDWVRPGSATWVWRVHGARADDYVYDRMDDHAWVRMVDFAAKHGLGYFEMDANWYGPEHSAASDPLSGGKAAEVRKLIRYAAGKGVGVLLYLNDRATRRHAFEDSIGFLPALLGQDFTEQARKGIVHHSFGGAFALRLGDWKLLPQMLFNMREDPCEKNNLYARHPEKVAKLSERLEEIKASGRSR